MATLPTLQFSVTKLRNSGHRYAQRRIFLFLVECHYAECHHAKCRSALGTGYILKGEDFFFCETLLLTSGKLPTQQNLLTQYHQQSSNFVRSPVRCINILRA
jgi:hypothetical protein